jgi:hypothetical protein
MFAIIKNEQIIWFYDKKPTKEMFDFDLFIQWDFDNSKQYIFKDWIVIEKTDDTITKKRKLIEKITESELLTIIETDDDFKDLHLKWKELWEFISKIFAGWNIYKELQIHRWLLEDIVSIVFEWKTPTEEQKQKAISLKEKSKLIERIINKF